MPDSLFEEFYNSRNSPNCYFYSDTSHSSTIYMRMAQESPFRGEFPFRPEHVPDIGCLEPSTGEGAPAVTESAV
jgi:hypothetical protein